VSTWGRKPCSLVRINALRRATKSLPRWLPYRMHSGASASSTYYTSTLACAPGSKKEQTNQRTSSIEHRASSSKREHFMTHSHAALCKSMRRQVVAVTRPA
jgi:hypothetical protein